MSGISMIQNNIQSRENRSSQSNESTGREVWLKDGDQVFMKTIATGEEGDIHLDDFHVYEFQQGIEKSWTSVLVENGEPVASVPSEAMVYEDGRRRAPRHKFAMWVYVTEILHTEQRVDSWEEVTSPSGSKLYKETVNDFKVMTLSFGAQNANWNQFVDIYEDNGTLDKSVIRVKRRGSALDTTYTITSTSGTMELPDDKQAEVKNLTPIKEYLHQRYGADDTASSDDVPSDAVSIDDDDDSLF
jgi:hypothetical protein|tara:strand:- start:827 stop:1558 length:732 start_codon:yes stop_codon:yes gene_type:complete